MCPRTTCADAGPPASAAHVALIPGRASPRGLFLSPPFARPSHPPRPAAFLSKGLITLHNYFFSLASFPHRHDETHAMDNGLADESTALQHVTASRVLTDRCSRTMSLSSFATCEQCKTVVRWTRDRTGDCRCPVRFFYAPPVCVATRFQNPMSGGSFLGTRYCKVV
jgi:hypothetical protein